MEYELRGIRWELSKLVDVLSNSNNNYGLDQLLRMISLINDIRGHDNLFDNELRILKIMEEELFKDLELKYQQYSNITK